MSAEARGAAVAEVGLCTPIGLTAAVTVAEMAAGTLRFAETEVHDDAGEPLRACRLTLLAPEASRADRMAALGVTAITEVLGALAERYAPREIPLFLGLPSVEGGAAIEERAVVSALAEAAHTSVRVEPIRTFRGGRAAFFQALSAAIAALHAAPRPQAILVGSVDSLCDPISLAELSSQGRILGGGNRDGLLPGEGAGFLVLTRPGAPASRLAIRGCSLAAEAIPFESREPSLAGGLTAALRALRVEPSSGDRRVDRVLSCQTGESFWATELARAGARNAALMPIPLVPFLAAESFGDAGAASGALLLGAAALFASREAGRRTLIYGCSDPGQIGACVVEAP